MTTTYYLHRIRAGDILYPYFNDASLKHQVIGLMLSHFEYASLYAEEYLNKPYQTMILFISTMD